MYEVALNTFIVLIVVIDPLGVAPIFAALTHGANDEFKRRMAVRGTVLSAVILVPFIFVGQFLLHALGITVDAFRIAGGTFLFLLSIDMVFARQSGLRSTTESETEEAEHRADISVFPLAIPLLAGPGAITTLLLMVAEYSEQPEMISIVILILFAVLLIAFVALIFAARLVKLLGQTGANVISRVLGILLSALAVQYILDGLRSTFLTIN